MSGSPVSVARCCHPRPHVSLRFGLLLVVSVSVIAVSTGRSWGGPLFAAAFLSFDTGPGPTSVAVGDVNGDGKPDLAVANQSADSISPAPEGAMRAEGWKSPSHAFLYSFLGTAIPVGAGGASALGNNELSAGALVAIGGAVLGPSLGHFYAQRKGRAIRGIVIRGAAAGIIAATVSSSDDGDDEGLAALFVGASIVGATFFVIDLAGAAHSARVHNQKLAGRPPIRVSSLVRPIAGAPGITVRVAY